jgi:hypothetical protein
MPLWASLSWNAARMAVRVASLLLNDTMFSGAKLNFWISASGMAWASRAAYCSSGHLA